MVAHKEHPTGDAWRQPKASFRRHSHQEVSFGTRSPQEASFGRCRVDQEFPKGGIQVPIRFLKEVG
ncbi:unnamed protein product [Prunus armeniaca]